MCIRDSHSPEGALAQALAGDVLAEPYGVDGNGGRIQCDELPLLQSVIDLIPKACTGALRGIIGLSLDDIAAPISRCGNPIGLVEKERRAQDDAADLGVNPRGILLPTVSEDLRAECRVIRGTILFLEPFPDKEERKAVRLDKGAAAYYVVEGIVKFEEK